MKTKKLPLNIALLDPSLGRLRAIKPTLSQDIYDSNGDFHPQGLYSTDIFGKVGSEARQIRASYIDMKTQIMHPKIFLELTRLKNLYQGIMSGTAYAVWNEKDKDFEKSDILDGNTGYGFFMSHFPDLVFKNNSSHIREMRIKLIDKWRGSCMYRYLIVTPAGLRDLETTDDGRVQEDDINGLYRKALRVANTINPRDVNSNDKALDTARWALQKNFNEIHDMLLNIFDGKRGFALSKYASRRISGGTRNVITAMDPAPRKIGAVDAVGVNDTMVGLHQFIVGTMDLTLHSMKTGIARELIDNINDRVPVVNSETLEKQYIEPSDYTRERWGTIDGLSRLVTGFEQLGPRHRPIIIDGHYLALLYKDEKTFKVFNDINELPEGFSRDNVRPITWAEYFYTQCYRNSQNTTGYPTRYPITGDGSVYVSLPYLKTTNRSVVSSELNDDWKPYGKGWIAPCFPIRDMAFFESMSVHISKIRGLGADHQHLVL